jgi:hypothetical protein
MNFLSFFLEPVRGLGWAGGGDGVGMQLGWLDLTGKLVSFSFLFFYFLFSVFEFHFEFHFEFSFVLQVCAYLNSTKISQVIINTLEFI